MSPYILFLPIVTLLLARQVTAFSNLTVEEIPESYLNLSAGNELWTSLIKNCRKPTMACVETNMYNYLRDTLDHPEDYKVAEFMKFKRNHVDYTRIKREYDEQHDADDRTDGQNELQELSEPTSSIEEMTKSLHDKTIQFLMTHNLEIKLPEMIFEGTTLKLSPQSFAENGALMKFEFLPKQVAEGRLFKKIKKFISEKLLFALLAILLVIKLLAAKFLFFMPMMMGAVAAKKLLIKVLLFLFPALHHIFKLCPYVPHGTKFHHHKHHIAHVHHLGHHHGHGPPHTHHGHHDSVEVIRPHDAGPPDFHHDSSPHWHPPSIHHTSDIDPPHKPLYNPHEMELEYYSGGPALTNHFITHDRKDSSQHNENEVHAWGQGQRKKQSRLPSATEIENMVLKAEKEALIKARLKQEKQRIQEENLRLQEQLKQAMRLQEKLKLQAATVKARLPGPKGLVPPPPPLPNVPPPNLFRRESTYGVPIPTGSKHQGHQVTHQAQGYQNSVHQEQQQQNKLDQDKLDRQKLEQQQKLDQQQKVEQQQRLDQQQILEQQQHKPEQKQQHQEEMAKKQSVNTKSHHKDLEDALHQAAIITYDPFYSPILDKIDRILVDLGFNDEPCRERLICSMYRSPAKFSPHSNLISAELSRDSKELQKPITTNAAVVRFYRYVQAARDGQDKRDCLRLYPTCSINTEK